MKNINVKMMFSLFLCFALIAGCSSGKYEVKEPAETGKEEAVSQDEQAEEESTEPAEGEEAAGSDHESLPEESVLGEEEEIQEGQVGTVAFTVCSADDSRAFLGKELTADPVYLQTAVSSEVYFCQKSLDRIEVHPIAEWAEDYSSFTFSEEIMGTVEPVEAEEAFRIYDLYPEGIPINCLVFSLEDGTCGTFALGYNGSGEEQTWDCPVYKNYVSMTLSREAEVKETAGAN